MSTNPVQLTDADGGHVLVTAANALSVDGSAVTQPVSGTVTVNPGTTFPVSGTVTASVAYQILIMFEDPNQNEVGTLFVPIEPGDNTLTLQLKLETALLETYGITSAITVIL